MYIDEIRNLSNEQIMRIIVELTFFEGWDNDHELEQKVRKYGKVVWEKSLKESNVFRGRNPIAVKVVLEDGSENVYSSMQEVIHGLNVSYNTIKKHLTDGESDSNGRRYQLLKG